VFPFHAPVFSLCIIMTDPQFITSDNATQKGITFLMITTEQVVTKGQMIMPVLFYELFLNQSHTNFMQV